MSKPDPKSNFTICRATLEDAPRIGDISTRAFDNDTHSQMKIMAQKPGAFAAGMEQGAWSRIKNAPGRCVAVKAVDDEDGTLLGWAAFGYRNVVLDPAPEGGDYHESDDDDDDDDDDGNSHPRPAWNHASTGEVSAAIPGAERIAELERMTSARTAAFSAAMMPEGAPCTFVAGISVDPLCHGRGVGSALLRWGTRQMDRLGVVCWVHSSEGAIPFYAGHGFEPAETLTLHLDDWAVGPPPEGGLFGGRERWGDYTIQYMVRQPVAVAPET